MEQKKNRIRLEAENDDPQFVAFFGVADAANDMLQDALKEIMPIPQAGRKAIYLHRWTIYLGTLLHELATATAQLLLLDMPRAAVVTNRQVFEYSIKTRYLHANEDEAAQLMDSVQRRVWEEAKRAPAHFSPDEVKRFEANYRKWAEDNPELDSKGEGTKFTPMARSVLGKRYDSEFFKGYSYPSIVGHAKPHGVVDVLDTEDGGRVIKHYWDSRTIDGLSELSRLASMTIEFVAFIRQKYALDIVKAVELNERHGAVQREFGYLPTLPNDTHEADPQSKA